MSEQDRDGDITMTNGRNKGIRLGTEPQMDAMLFDNARDKKQLYDTSIDPMADEDEEMDESERQMTSKRQPIEGHAFFLKDAAEDGHGAGNQNQDDISGSQKSKQIISRMSEYQQRYLDRTYTPARADPFATPALQQQTDHSISITQSKADDYSKKLREETLRTAEQRLKSDGIGGRTYKDIMNERKLEEEKAELRQIVNDLENGRVKSSKTEADENTEDNKIKTDKITAQDWAATPLPKASRWDATPGPGKAGATPSNWVTTPAVVSSQTPGLWGATPGATPGIGTPGARTPGQQRGSRTPGLGWEETPHGGKTPKLGYTPSRFAMTPGATTPFGVTPGVTPSRTRWGATPDIRGGKTPISKFGETPALGATPAATPGTVGAMGLATPGTPADVGAEVIILNKIRQEIDSRNQPWTNEDVEKILEGETGYQIVQPPASYVPRQTFYRTRLQATPTPAQQTPGYIMPSTPAAAETSGFEVPNDPTLPNIKPEEYQFFQELIDKKDEDVEDPDEIKKRMILKLVLKIKNGTPPQRKGALRQITDKARWFGPKVLFDTILPLLMSPTLEDQERHMLVKIIDRILYKLDELVRPFVHKILVVIEPLLIDEDYYARVEGREIIANLSKAAGLASMIATMRPDIDNKDEYVRNTTARAFSVVASALGIPVLIPFLKAVCQSRKSWEARHTGIKIVQQISILMGCAVLPHLRQLVEIIEQGLEDEQPKVRTICALALAALAESAAPYGYEAFDTVLRPLWHGISSHHGKTRAAFFKAIGYIIPLMDAEYASYYTREVMPQLVEEFESTDEEMKKIVLKVVKQCVCTDGVEASYVVTEILPPFFRHFWNRRMALDRRNYRQLVETTHEIAKKVGGAQIIQRIVGDLMDENETYRKMVMETIDKVIQDMGVADIDQKLEETLIDGILYSFEEQTAEDANVVLSGFGTIMNALGIRCAPYLPQICGIIKFRLGHPNARVRQQAADVVARIATVIRKCEKVGLLKHLGQVLFQLLGEEYPDVLGSMLGGLKAVVNEVGMQEMQPPIKDIVLRLTPILKNRHEKVQENCIDLVGRIADRGSEAVSPKEWMRIAYELLDMLKAHKKGIRRAAVNTFGYIAKAVGPQDVLEILLNNLRVQERQNRVCTTIAIAIVAETCRPFTTLPALMNEYRVPELNVQNGVLKALSFLFEYIGETARDYVYSVLPLLEDALNDRDIVHRQTASAVVKHLALGVYGTGCEDALLHLLNYVWPNVFDTTPHLIQTFTDAIDALRVALGPGVLFQYNIAGLFHPARRVRNVYWRLYNLLYVGNQDALVAFYPIFDAKLPQHTLNGPIQNNTDYRRQECFYFV